jgi:hypothetical protein
MRGGSGAFSRIRLEHQAGGAIAPPHEKRRFRNLRFDGGNAQGIFKMTEG